MTPNGVSVICRGSYYEMGLAQGCQLIDMIHSAIDTCMKDATFLDGKPWWMPTWLFIWISKLKAARMLSSTIKRTYPNMQERMDGFASGCEIDRPMCYFISAFEPILASVSSRSRVPPACSALAVRGSRSASGEPFIVRNMDYAPVIRPYLILREDRPQGRYRSLQYTVATNCGAVDGMNEHGLCITYNYANTTDDKVPGAPVSFAITEALERCKTVREAVELIGSSPRWGGAILMLLDAEGDMASLELSTTRTALRRPAGGEDILFHTNAFSTEGMRAVQVADQAVFTEPAPEALRGCRVLESAERRYARLAELTGKAAAPLTVEDAALIMSDHGHSGIASQNTICMHGPSSNTIASLQYFPRRRAMRAAFTSACKAQHLELGF